MNGIKGVVILTRFDFITNRYGADTLKNFQRKIEPAAKNLLRQPVVLSKDYPESILKIIDETMLQDFFNGSIDGFRDLGRWNAGLILPRYFQLYMDNADAAGFLQQMVRMRPVLFGLGDMHLNTIEKNNYAIHISYGQPFMESIKLSEIAYLEEGCRLCGAANVKCEELQSSDISIDYQISWD